MNNANYEGKYNKRRSNMTRDFNRAENLDKASNSAGGGGGGGKSRS